MKKLKYLLWLIVIMLVALAVYQNREFFIEGKSLGIDLGFESFKTPELPAGVYYLAVFLIGLLISYFSTLPRKFRSRKTIRQLNEKIAADEKKISRLEAEIAAGSQTREKPAGVYEYGQSQDQEEPRDTEAVWQQTETKDKKTGE
ncbi:MAG: LapA family protein [Desulfobacteraceae bacterium]|nr:LapA family protein [Desulfobacteraceae bacterium]